LVIKRVVHRPVFGVFPSSPCCATPPCDPGHRPDASGPGCRDCLCLVLWRASELVLACWPAPTVGRVVELCKAADRTKYRRLLSNWLECAQCALETADSAALRCFKA